MMTAIVQGPTRGPARGSRGARAAATRLLRPGRILRLDTAPAALAWYAAATVIMTWPVSASLATRLPLDLGDPLLNCWILWWGLDHLARFAAGDWGALAGFWNANIFYPEPLALAYSEHLLAQVVQALPVYALTGNVVLSYNLLFLSTFALSGLGMYLLARELTGRPAAAFVAGLLYAFAPYRTSQFGHLQVLSSQWMPFALYGLRLYVDRAAAGARARRRLVPLLGAAAALVLQSLSCGYFLLFFAPFAALYALFEAWRRDLIASPRTWAELAGAAVVTGAGVAPFLLPYLAVRDHGFAARTLEEVQLYSADAYSYLAGTYRLRLWAPHLSDFGKLEGFLFPGAVAPVLAAAGLLSVAWAAARSSAPVPPTRGWRLALAAGGGLVAAGFLGLAAWELQLGPAVWKIRETFMPLAYVDRVLALAALSLLLVAAASPAARRVAARTLRSPAAFFFLALLLATWLSFGPQVRTRGYGLTGETIYAWLYRYVPGFDGLRVPSRFAMLGALFLAALSAWSLAALDAWKRWGRVAVAAIALVFLAEAWAAPLEVEALAWARRDAPGPGRVVREADLAPLYDFLRAEASAGRGPGGQGAADRAGAPARRAVVLELPFGDLHGETRAVYFSARHGLPLVNGYSGGFPARYLRLKEQLSDPLFSPDDAWQAVRDSGATHLVLHEWAFEGRRGAEVRQWLEAHGARLLGGVAGSKVYRVG